MNSFIATLEDGVQDLGLSIQDSRCFGATLAPIDIRDQRSGTSGTLLLATRKHTLLPYHRIAFWAPTKTL